MTASNFGFFAYAPLNGLVSAPERYGCSKKDQALVKRIQKDARHGGATFMRDMPVSIILVKDLRKKHKLIGWAWSPATPFVHTYYIMLDESLLQAPAEFRSTIHHELGHILASTYGDKDVWHMDHRKQLAKYGCSADMDRWTWHMQRAFEQLTFVDEAAAAAWRA